MWSIIIEAAVQITLSFGQEGHELSLQKIFRSLGENLYVKYVLKGTWKTVKLMIGFSSYLCLKSLFFLFKEDDDSKG